MNHYDEMRKLSQKVESLKQDYQLISQMMVEQLKLQQQINQLQQSILADVVGTSEEWFVRSISEDVKKNFNSIKQDFELEQISLIQQLNRLSQMQINRELEYYQLMQQESE